jgi:oxygen-independent coproporphyrinogen-3 oxidase
VDKLTEIGFIHYELSNFGKSTYFSKNNSSYWLGKKYIGIGPSAHSYDGISRSWNVSNNSLYLKSISEKQLPSETETLSKTDKYNEYVMTGLRTIWGISLERIEREFGKMYLDYLNKQAAKYIDDHLLFVDDNILRTTKSGKFLSDGIASDLFLLNLE